MARLADLLNTTAKFSGNYTDVLTRAGKLQKAGILPPGSRKRGDPQIENVHENSLLLAVLKAGPQIDAVKAVEELWHMPGVGTLYPDARVNGGFRFAPYGGAAQTFGQYVAWFIEMAASPHPETRAALQDMLATIAVTRDIPHAQINYLGGRVDYFQLDAKFSSDETLRLTGTIATATTAGPVTLAILGDLLRRSRDEAARRNIRIPTEDAYRALGLVPPGGDGPGFPNIPGILPTWSASASQETTKAEGPPSPSAFAGQTATSQPCPRDCRQDSDTDGDTQQVGSGSI